MRVIAPIEERDVIVKILSYLGLPPLRFAHRAPSSLRPVPHLSLTCLDDACARCDDDLPVFDAAA